MLDLGRLDDAAVADRGVGADVGVAHDGAAPMIAGPRTVARSRRAPSSTTTRPSTWESTSSPSTRRSSVSSTSRLASSMSARRPVSFHQPRTMCDSTVCALVDEPLDRVGDLELSAGDGSMERAAVWMSGVNM